MDRRKTLKLIATGALATGAAAIGCNTPDEKKEVAPAEPKFALDRSPQELVHEKSLLAAGPVFTAHEMTTITLLADIIIPKDEVSGSASDAGVPAFIEFIVKDMPQHQLPMLGGLRWLDIHCLKRFDKSFADLTAGQRLEVVDDIAYPAKAKPGFKQGVKFFSLMRNLTASGFYTSEIGVKDIGYAGNQANDWNGVPDDVLKQYGVSYTPKELAECVSFKEVV
ncbi:MAG: gluconate 2-dehydrogenase subunit 3 family protein [Chitinophagaceae bacterium]